MRLGILGDTHSAGVALSLAGLVMLAAGCATARPAGETSCGREVAEASIAAGALVGILVGAERAGVHVDRASYVEIVAASVAGTAFRDRRCRDGARLRERVATRLGEYASGPTEAARRAQRRVHAARTRVRRDALRDICRVGVLRATRGSLLADSLARRRRPQRQATSQTNSPDCEDRLASAEADAERMALAVSADDEGGVLRDARLLALDLPPSWGGEVDQRHFLVELTLATDLLFQPASTRLTPTAERTLAALSEVLATPPGHRASVAIVAQTDPSGDPDSDLRLTQLQANVVATTLRRTLVPSERLISRNVLGRGGQGHPGTRFATPGERVRTRQIQILLLLPPS